MNTKALLLGRPDPYTRTVPVLVSTSKPVDGVVLETWDLTRFLSNPVILVGHRDDDVPVALAESIQDGPHGLTMTARFPAAGKDPQSDRVFEAILDGRMRGVSVGYLPGKETEETIDGKPVKVMSANVLGEVSFVAVPKEDGAGTAAIANPGSDERQKTMNEHENENDEQRKARISYHARELAIHRQASLRTDAAEDFERYDRTRVGRLDKTPAGGAQMVARVARTGVLVYRNPDGTTRRELRLPEEVFKTDSLATLHGAPVIDIKDHTGMVTPSTFRKVTLGHAESVRQDGETFVSATLHINDGETLARIDRGERTEISCGYTCNLDATPGVWNGQEYDCVQRNIRYNHVALCPPNRGRSGPEVGLRLDATAAVSAAECTTIITTEESTDMKIRLDGKEYDAGSTEHLDAIDALHKAEVAKVTTDLTTKHEAEKVALQKELDATKGRLDSITEEAAKLRVDADTLKAGMRDEAGALEARAMKLAKRSYGLKRAWRKLFGKDTDKDPDADDDEDEKKLDAMTDREIQVACITKAQPKFDAKDADGKDRSDDYIAARFDAVMETAKKADGKRVGDVVVAATEGLNRLDAVDGDATQLVAAVEAARIANHNEGQTAWQRTLAGPTATAAK